MWLVLIVQLNTKIVEHVFVYSIFEFVCSFCWKLASIVCCYGLSDWKVGIFIIHMCICWLFIGLAVERFYKVAVESILKDSMSFQLVGDSTKVSYFELNSSTKPSGIFSNTQNLFIIHESVNIILMIIIEYLTT